MLAAGDTINLFLFTCKGIMFYIVNQRGSLKLCYVCCGRASGNGRHSLDAFALKTSPPFLLLIYIYSSSLRCSSGAPPPQLFASFAPSSVAGRTVFTILLENRFSKRSVFTMANEIGIPGITIFTIVLNRAFLREQFLQYFLRRGVNKQQKKQ